MQSYTRQAGTHPIKRLETLDMVIAYANVNLTIAKMDNSISEINKKSPHRKDLIDSMQKTIDDLHEALDTFRQMEINMIAANRRNLDLELICMKQQIELNQLTKQNAELLKGL